MSDDESTKHYNTTQQAYSAGLNKGKELQRQADAEAKGDDHGKEMSYDRLKEMSYDELIEQKQEVDAWLEKQGRER